MVRIGIDARLYGIASGTGIGRYTQELLRQFSDIPNAPCNTQDSPPSNAPLSEPELPSRRPPEGWEETTTEFVVFLRRDGYEAFEPPHDGWTKVLADFRPYTLGVQTHFPRIIRNARVDLMHFTHFDHPIRCPVPFVITIHDLILLEHPSIRASALGPLRFWMKYAAYRRTLRHAAENSLRVLTPSQAVKEHIANRFGILREKIIATPLGREHALRKQGGKKQEAKNGQVEASLPHCLLPPCPYLLYVGNAYPHKNVEQLIRIAPALHTRHPNLRIVLVGREDDFSRKLQTTVYPSRSNVDRTPIVFAGPVSEAELHALMANATAYVSPSFAEGFDLPPLEAAALGTPVIATNISVHREILGDAFLPFSPHDDTALVDTIHRVLIHSELRATLRDRGLTRAQLYSWRACAMQTRSAYREALALRI